MSWLQRLSRRGHADTDRAEVPAPAPRLTREGPDRDVGAPGRHAGTAGIFRRPSRGLAIAAAEGGKGPSSIELPYPAAPAAGTAPASERRAVPREHPATSPEPTMTGDQATQGSSMAEGLAQPEVDLGLPPLRVLGVVGEDDRPPATEVDPPDTRPVAEDDRPEPSDEPTPPPDPVEQGWAADPIAPVLGDLPAADTGADLWLGGETAEPEPPIMQPHAEHEGSNEDPAAETPIEPVDHVLAEPAIVIDAPPEDEPPLHVEGLGERTTPLEAEHADREVAAAAEMTAATGGHDELAATLGGDFEDPNLRLAAAAGRPVVAMRRREEAIGSIVDCRVQPVGGLRVDPLALGPYRFPSAASADDFVDETMRALEYLGCDVA